LNRIASEAKGWPIQSQRWRALARSFSNNNFETCGAPLSRTVVRTLILTGIAISIFFFFQLIHGPREREKRERERKEKERMHHDDACSFSRKSQWLLRRAKTVPIKASLLLHKKEKKKRGLMSTSFLVFVLPWKLPSRTL